MSPQDWDQFISIMHGDGDPASTAIKEKVLSVPEGTPYLVYDNDWQPSETPELPADDWDPPMQGEWVVTDAEGKVLDRFSDWTER